MHASAAVRANLPAAIFGYIASGAAVAALLGSALNLIELAAYLLVASIAYFILGLLLFLHLRLARADRDRFLSMPIIRRAFHALAVSCAYWYARWWLPLDYVPPYMRELLARHWRKLISSQRCSRNCFQRRGVPAFTSTFAVA
jgi:hypothetical protein